MGEWYVCAFQLFLSQVHRIHCVISQVPPNLSSGDIFQESNYEKYSKHIKCKIDMQIQLFFPEVVKVYDFMTWVKLSTGTTIQLLFQ